MFVLKILLEYNPEVSLSVINTKFLFLTQATREKHCYKSTSPGVLHISSILPRIILTGKM